jgi:serine protease Do
VGEWVLAMGSPFGLDHTVTAGIVSAKGRWIGAGPYDDFIQTDASINPGNSGGPLINIRGEVVGVNTAIVSRSGGNMGIGFAIPINLAKEILPELIKTGKVTRGWLGVTIQRVTPDLAKALGLEKNRGALVADVAPGSPAHEAGIKTGDVIVDYNGQPVQDSNELPILVARTDVGQSAKVTVIRDNKRVPVTVRIGELKDEEVVASAPEPGKLGLTVQNVTPELAESLGLRRSEGVVVTSVDPQSPAAEAGIQRGDVILEANRTRIANAAVLRKVLENTKPGESTLFLIKRGGNNLFLALKQPEAKG